MLVFANVNVIFFVFICKRFYHCPRRRHSSLVVHCHGLTPHRHGSKPFPIHGHVLDTIPIRRRKGRLGMGLRAVTTATATATAVATSHRPQSTGHTTTYSASCATPHTTHTPSLSTHVPFA
jgi:hypothetical protein